MGTLSSCLKKSGLSAHEAAILRGAADDNAKDGDAANVAAVRAVADLIEQLEAERATLVAQIETHGGVATDAPFKLADLAHLTTALRGEAPKDSGLFSAPTPVSSAEEMTKALMADEIVSLPSGRLVRMMQDNYGWNHFYRDPDDGGWQAGARAVGPEGGLTSSKEWAVERAIKKEGSSFTQNQLAFADAKPTIESNTPEGEQSVNHGTGSESSAPLVSVASGEGGSPAGRGDAGGSPAERGSGGGGGNPVADGLGLPSPRGRRGSAGTVHSPAAGAAGNGRGRPGARTPVQRDESGGGGGNQEVRPGAPGLEPSAPNIPAANFVITPDLLLGQGGEDEKFRDNIAAINTLKQIESEQRRATPEEQRVLARYVGWGGLSNAFGDGDKFKAGWEDRGRQLVGLLTPEEHRAASRSTINAHYTSETVVRAMWEAAYRLGYRGGLALESSVGTGNFIGMMPEDLARDTRVLGVEFDSITARIAKALYPQEHIIHSGFEKVPVPSDTIDLNIGNPPFGKDSLPFQFLPSINGRSIHNQFFLAGADAIKPGGLQIMVVSRYLMDAQDSSSRSALAKKMRLLGAIRLPDMAFKENAGTSVVTDILFLQKLTTQEQDAMESAINADNQKPSKNDTEERLRREMAARAPGWIKTAEVKDPLGAEAMVVGSYFKDHPEMVVGIMERSGSQQFPKQRADGTKIKDITVRLDNKGQFPDLLDAAIRRLPSDVATLGNDAIAASLERFKSMSDAIEITMSGREAYDVQFDEDGGMVQVFERETPEGSYELTKRVLNESSPWSRTLMLDKDGKWFRMVVRMDEAGNPVKMRGKPDSEGNTLPLTTNEYIRETFDTDADIPESLLLGKTKIDRLRRMVTLRNLLKQQLILETRDAPPAELEENRAKLLAEYRDFVKRNDHISASKNAALVSEMPDGALVLALELSYRPEITKAKALRSGDMQRKASAVEAPIMHERVIVPYEPPASANSAADALLITLAESGSVDLERIAALLGTDPESAIAMLHDNLENPLIYHDPETAQWVTTSEYLSGQVRRKVSAARAAALHRNVEALEKVMPELWGAEKVTVKLGSSWVPVSVWEAFASHLSGSPAKVQFSRITNAYSLRTQNGKGAAAWSVEADGGVVANVEKMVGDLLNSRTTTITQTDSDGTTRVDKELTAVAMQKAKVIVNEFADWVFSDPGRRNMLVEAFNEKFNTRVPRQRDGSHLTLPGKVPDEIIKMRRHQLNAIWRGITERFMLIDHAVGAGKTYTAIARAMERRRMGLSKKPAIVVPNHMVEQFTSDVYRLYPGAKVLAAGNADFEKKRRRRLFAKIATGDWDLVIIPHSSFGKIAIAKETEERFLLSELEAALQAIKDAKEQAAEDGTDQGFRTPFNVKEAEHLYAAIETRLDKLRTSKQDALLTFEQMGIDDLTIDESHEFKNLFYSTRLTKVRGMGTKQGSGKAVDLYNKVRVLRESKTGTVTFMTGTPISNSAVEMYSIMRYLAADELEELGISHFDAWRSMFVDTATKYEPNEGGRLVEVNRLGRTWSNMRSLMDLYYSFTDSVSNDDIKRWYPADNDGKEFPIPKVKGGGRRMVVTQPTPAQEAQLEAILHGFDHLEYTADIKQRNKDRLRLMDQARKVSLDVRAVNRYSQSKEVGGKLEKVSAEVARIYGEWTADKGTQLVFLDRSVPKSKGDAAKIKEYDALVKRRDDALESGDEDAYNRITESLERFDQNEMEELRAAQNGGWNAYQQIKDNLVALGIPPREIRFIQEANNDAQKQAMFDAVKSGEIRVLIGSTQRMGAGTNVQERLVGLHHVDVTWKPSDIEQREGRIIRQGNHLLEKYGDEFEVEIVAYATERSVDAKMWDLNATKLKTINGIRNYNGDFTMELDDADSVSMAEMAALVSGDPLLMERVQLMAEIDTLEMLARAHRRREFGIEDEVLQYEQTISRTPGQIELSKRVAGIINDDAKAEREAADARTVTVEGKKYDSAFDAAKAAEDAIALQRGAEENARYTLNIAGQKVTTKEGINDAINSALGDSDLFSIKIKGEQMISRSPAAAEIVKMANALASGLEPGKSDSAVVGQYKGLELELDVDAKGHFSGRTEYVATLSLSTKDGNTVASDYTKPIEKPAFATASVRAMLRQLDAVASRQGSGSTEYLERKLAEAIKELPEVKARVGQPFSKQGELNAKTARLNEVTLALAASGKKVVKDDDAPSVLRSVPDAEPGHVARGVDVVTANSVLDGIIGPMLIVPDHVVVERFDQLPQAIQQDALEQDSGPENTKGVFHKGVLYVVAENHSTVADLEETILHELIGHFGMRELMGPGFIQKMNALFVSLGGLTGLRALAKEHGFGSVFEEYIEGMEDAQNTDPKKYTQEMANFVLTEEVFAHIAEKRPALMQKVKEFIGMVREWLRRMGFAELSMYGDTDVANLLRQARNKLNGGGGPRGGVQIAAPSVLHRAFHGSPREHNKFDSAFNMSGEGANSYGRGHYFADSRAVAEHYKEVLSRGIPQHNTIDGKRITKKVLAELQADRSNQYAWSFFNSKAGMRAAGITDMQGAVDSVIETEREEQDRLLGRAAEYRANPPAASTYAAEDYERLAGFSAKKIAALEVLRGRLGYQVAKKGGKLYEVELAPSEDEYLDWDKPLSEQSALVRKAVVEARAFAESKESGGITIKNVPDSTLVGSGLYGALERATGSDTAASAYLHSIGVRGVRYLDGASRRAGNGNHNYVIFNDEDVSIVAVTRRGEDGSTSAAWSPERIESAMSKYAYTMDDNRTKAYVAWVSPGDFLNATSTPTDTGRLEGERKPLDRDALRQQSQDIMLYGQFDGTRFVLDGHEGRHRMMALRDEGIASVPVVFYTGQGHRAVVKESLTVTPENFGRSIGVAQSGFVSGRLTPLNYANLDAVKAEFGSDDAPVVFRRSPSQWFNEAHTTLSGDSHREHTDEQLQFFRNTGRTVTHQSVRDKLKGLWQNAGKKLAQGLVDQFAPLKELSKHAYILARLSKATSGAFEALLKFGKLNLVDGVYDADMSGGVIARLFAPLQGEGEDFLWWVAANRAERLKAETAAAHQRADDIRARAALMAGEADAMEASAKEMLQQAGDFPKSMTGSQRAQKENAAEAERLLRQARSLRREVADMRAEASDLAAINRERLFTDDDVLAGKSLTDGDTDFDYMLQHGQDAGTTTRSRALIYGDALKTLDEFNKNVMDMAEESGLIDGEARKLWEHEFYVPFYRANEEDGSVRGMNIKSALVRQVAFKALKGGTDKLNSDLMANTLQNWAHLIDASAKNRAATASLQAASLVGAAEPSLKSGLEWDDGQVFSSETGEVVGDGTLKSEHTTAGKGTLWHMDGGKMVHYTVTDPMVLTALSSLEYAGLRGPMMDAMSAFKHALTIGVTASPFFKVRNLIRDSVSAIGVSGLGYNVFGNIAEGFKSSSRESQTHVSMLASGGLIRFGTMLENNEAGRVRQLVKNGVIESTILNSESALKRFYDERIEPMIAAYNELGNRGEEINRAALYTQLVRDGMGHAEASYLARDMMDFSMQGAWTSVRFLTQIVPFMNARMQGLYKLGRAAHDDPRKLAIVLGAVSVLSVGLMLAYEDDDDWKKREDWDRDNFWWFKIGGHAYRIPKPFEIGAIGTLAERGIEFATNDEMTGQRFRKRLLTLLADNLSMNPTPQIIKPVIDVYANKDSFSGRPIETMGMDKLKSDYRYTSSTSMTARGLSTAGNAVTGLLGGEFASPVQIDHMIRGYFGWLGSFVVGSADVLARPALGENSKPAADMWKVATGSMVSSLSGAQSRYVSQIYDQAKIVEAAYATHAQLVKEGRIEEAQQFKVDHADELGRHKHVERIKKSMSDINRQIRAIELSTTDGDVKHDQITALKDKKDRVARTL